MQTTIQLRKLGPTEWKVDSLLAFDVFDEHGSLFRREGLKLSKQDLVKARKRLQAGLYVRADQVMPPAPGSQITEEVSQVRNLQPGQQLKHDVFDEHGRLIQTAGKKISSQFVQFIENRDISATEITPTQPLESSSVLEFMRPKQLRSITTRSKSSRNFPATEQWDEEIDSTQVKHPRNGTAEVVEPRLDLTPLREKLETGHLLFSQSVQTYTQIAHDALAGKMPSLASSEELVDSMTGLLDQDPNLAILLMDLQSTPEGDYLFNHSLNTSIMAMRVASRLGWETSDVQKLGLAALIGDMGMLRIPQSIRMATRPLAPDEQQVIQTHPFHTIKQLERTGYIDPLVMLIAFQAHERCDGSGYPRGRVGKTIHPLARILGAADLYCAVTCPRPHRAAQSSHVGMVTLLREAYAGRLDRQVIRAFVDSLSLFPVGSYVRLTDGSAARVIRGGNALHTQPTVLPLNRDGSETNLTLNLARHKEQTITAALSYQEATGKIIPPPTFSQAG